MNSQISEDTLLADPPLNSLASAELARERVRMMREIASTFNACAESNWDGHGSQPIGLGVLITALQFARALPVEIQQPTVGAEPDGNMTFEWYHSPVCTLSVSVSETGDLHYAALLGAGKAYGTEPFDQTIPEAILQLIQRVNLP